MTQGVDNLSIGVRSRCPIWVPASFFVWGDAIHNVLVIAQRQALGACLEGLLQEHGYHTTVSESYGRFSNVLQYLVRKKFDLVIVTNTSIPPADIPSIVPDIKAQHPHGHIMVLSGYSSEDFVEDLKQKGMDRFLPLPFQEDALLGEVARLLSSPTH